MPRTTVGSQAATHRRLAAEIAARRKAEEAARFQAAELACARRELEQFARVAAHDLQEPLRKIIAFGDLLAASSESVLDEKGRDYLARMRTAAFRMRQLIEGLLQLSRVTSKELRRAPVDLSLTAAEALADLEAPVRRSRAVVTLGPLPAVAGDAQQLRLLLFNLLSNAVKFCRKELPPHVLVTGRRRPDGWVEIQVADDGIGFDEKFLDRIFQPFQRLHAFAEYEGAGLGLAVCRRIVERHGGTLGASGAPDRGATFTVALPPPPQ